MVFEHPRTRYGSRPARNGWHFSYFILGTLAWMAAAQPLGAQVRALTRPVDLATLTRRAEVIVEGRIVSTRYEPLPGYSNIRTVVVTVEVERMLRGPAGPRFTFRQYLGGSSRRVGKPVYSSGEKVLLFMPAESSAGLRSPLALEQGHFVIRRDGTGAEFIANKLNNALLFRNVAATAQKSGVKLADDQLQLTARPGGPVPLATFMSLVEDLMRLPRNE